MQGKSVQRNNHRANQNTQEQVTKTEKSRVIAQQTIQETSFSGPLPPASELVAYKQIQEDFPERIFKMAESDLDHIHRTQKIMVWSESITSILGVISAFTLGMFTIYIGYLVAKEGGTIEGSILSGVGLAGLVSAFIYGTRRNSNKNDKEES